MKNFKLNMGIYININLFSVIKALILTVLCIQYIESY